MPYTIHMASFIFIRHGKSQANADNIITPVDSPLVPEGEAQARKVGRELRSKHIAVIVSSPYIRARRTAEIIAKQLKYKKDIVIIDDLRERGLGELEGRPKERESAWYATTDGAADIEPRGVVIARAEAALNAIKKLTEQGEVLVVGHTMAGFYLQQVAAGKRYFEQFDPYKQIGNAVYRTIEINPIKSKPVEVKPRLLASFIALVLGAILLIVGITLLVNRQPTPQADKPVPNIPLAPEDYNGDPNLQNAIQKQLQQQSANTQSQNDAANTLQPVPQGIPK